MFGKLMSIPDPLMEKYLRLVAGLSEDGMKRVIAEHDRPERLKRALAARVVELYHGAEAAEQASARFDAVFVEGRQPSDVPEVAIPADCVSDGRVYVPRFLAAIGFARSGSAARKLIEHGGVYLDGERLEADEIDVGALRGRTLAVGKRHFARPV